MVALAFDTLKAARHLIEAGMPPRQAEAQAEVMAEAFVFNIDSLVTKDYLDARFSEYDARLDARFGEQNARMDGLVSSTPASTSAWPQSSYSSQEWTVNSGWLTGCSPWLLSAPQSPL